MAVSIASLLENHVVPQSGTEVFHNALDDVEKVGSRVEDVFDAFDRQKSVNDGLAAQKAARTANNNGGSPKGGDSE
ncbi:MAG: hypothetical protein LUC18_04690 [Porphyromonadaceae bacterium]|nr:hypothetical protein [Porphyromonadaceae bacterium]